MHNQNGAYAGVPHMGQDIDTQAMLANKVRWVRFEHGGDDHRLHMLLCTNENVHVWDVQNTEEVCEVAVIACKRAVVCKMLQNSAKSGRSVDQGAAWDMDRHHDRLLLAVVSSTYK
ncbi:hypothetical protein SARC_14902, partial [Sphaeroforma arctica JP610]